MRVGIVLGAAREAMEQRLARALEEGYDKIIISGRTNHSQTLDKDFIDDELNCLEDKLKESGNVQYLEAFTTFGNYLGACEATSQEDELFFIGHESHLQRTQVYQEYFKDRKIENTLLEDPNLRFIYRLFDRFSASIYQVSLKLFPSLIIEQTRNKNSFLNRYVIPVKNMVLNKKSTTT